MDGHLGNQYSASSNNLWINFSSHALFFFLNYSNLYVTRFVALFISIFCSWPFFPEVTETG